MKKIKEYKGIIIVVLVILGILIYLNQNQKAQEEQIEIKIQTPPVNKITSQGQYSLDCSSLKYTAINIGGFLIPESTINISDGHEKQVLYIEDKEAKYFGAEYEVIQDDELYLVIARSYSASGLTEIISINKEQGVGFDTNTKTMGLTGGPTTATYMISCSEI